MTEAREWRLDEQQSGMAFVGNSSGWGRGHGRNARRPQRRWSRFVVAAKSGSKKNRTNGDILSTFAEGEVGERDLDVVLCHLQADYDTLAAAVGLAKLWGPDAIVVLSGGSNPAVERFLGLFRPMFPIRSPKSVDVRRLRTVGVVDTVKRDRLGPCADWTTVAESVEVIDHHVGAVGHSASADGNGASTSGVEECDIENINEGLQLYRERVGAATTLVVERLMRSDLSLTPGEATLMALGIHTDTGSLTFENTTARDARALAWLLEQGANQSSVAEFKTQQLNDAQMEVLNLGLQRAQKVRVHGVTVGHCMIETEDFVKGLSVVAQDVMQLSNIDVLIFCVVNNVKHRNGKVREREGRIRKQISLIGRVRARVDASVDLNAIFSPLGGGGHAKAAAVTIRTEQDPLEILEAVVKSVQEQIPEEQLARDFMSKDIVVCRPQDSMLTAQDLMVKHCLSGLPVVSEENELVGTVLQTDVWTAEKQTRLEDEVFQFMRKGSHVVTIGPETTLPEVERLLALGKAGPLPVVSGDQIIGLVTRIDVLRARHLWSEDENEDDDFEESQGDLGSSMDNSTSPSVPVKYLNAENT
mmetsp:Transcript_10933/g.33520  ORF Transcript_10933/g.33520 Transcript_10933/m.33520 type:complete len:586 (+) Transcript_10933:394-2151(+)